jgi:hypothetical protein
MVHFILGIVFAILALVALAIAALTMRGVIDLIRDGPDRAQRAYMRGDCLKKWWCGRDPLD